jgi:hypothetical protein
MDNLRIADRNLHPFWEFQFLIFGGLVDTGKSFINLKQFDKTYQRVNNRLQC